MRKAIVGLIVALFAVSSLANASPLWQVKGGQTSIVFGESLATALADCDVSRIKPGVYKPDEAKVRFRVVGGALDAGSPAGEVFHGGGIAVSCPAMGDGPVLALQSFIIDLQDEPGLITGLVTVSGGDEPEIRGRQPLFTVGGDELERENGGNDQWLKLRNVDLTPTQQLADLLLELGLALEGEGAVARAWTRVQLRKPDNGKGKGKDEEDSEDGEEGDDDDEEDGEGE